MLKWAGLAAALLLVISCFMPWVFIESRALTFTGVNTSGSNFGKPGYLHFVMVAAFLPLTLIPRIWAKRVNLVVVALNIAWAIRNFIMIGVCQGGECPVKKAGLFLALTASVLMFLSALFPDVKLSSSKKG